MSGYEANGDERWLSAVLAYFTASGYPYDRKQQSVGQYIAACLNAERGSLTFSTSTHSLQELVLESSDEMLGKDRTIKRYPWMAALDEATLSYGGGPSGGGGEVLPTFFVDSAVGSDSNPGTQAQPWQTLAKVSSQSFLPGTTVSFQGGQSFSGTLTIPNGGSAGRPVTITSYGTGNATIAPAANAHGVVATNLSYLTIKNLNVVGSGTSAAADGIQINNTSGTSTGLLIDGCSCSGFSHDGILLSVTGGQMVNPTITNCTTNGNSTGVFNNGCGLQLRGVYGAQMSGVYSFINPYIFGCVANSNLGAAGTSNWCGSGIHTAQCSGGIILSCSADSNGQNCNASSGPSGIWISDCNGHVIQSCESSNNKTANADGVGFDMDGGTTACVMQYCYSHGNQGAGLMSFTYTDPSFISGNFNNVIRFNVSMNDCTGAGTAEGGIYVVSAASSVNTGLQVYGNTVFTQGTSATSACLVVSNGSTLTMTLANNILTSRSSSKLAIVSGGGTLAVTGNCWFPTAGQSFSMTWAGTTYSSYAAWQAATNLEKIAGSNVGLNQDPLVVNNGYSSSLSVSSASQRNSYKLAPGSPCLGAGVNLLTQYGINAGGRDYYGSTVPRSGAYDVGCSTGAAVLSSLTQNYTDHAEDATGQTTYTWAAKAFAIGSAQAGRIVVAAITARIGGNTTATCSSVTIGGIAATKINDSRQTNGGALTTQSMWMAVVPNGTTATVSATFSNAMLRSAVSIYTVNGSSGDVPRNINSSAFNDATTGTVATNLVTTPYGGSTIVASSVASVSSGTPTLTPTNYVIDEAATAIGITFVGAGHPTSAAGPQVYTSTWTGTTPQSVTGAAASFLPTIT